jgi:hypothetical protein
MTELLTSPGLVFLGETPVRHRREFGVKLPDGTVQVCDDEDDARLRAASGGTVIHRGVYSVRWADVR